MSGGTYIPQWIGDRILGKPGLTWTEKVAFLAHSLHKHSIECPLEHRFEPGWYIRTIRIPAGVAFIGRTHLTGHLCKLLEGSLVEVRPTERIVREAPYEVLTTRGTQLVLWTLTDIVAETWHENPLGCESPSAFEPAIFESAESTLRRGREVEARLIEAGNAQASYLQMLNTYGMTEEMARRISETENDLVEWPEPVGVELGSSLIGGTGVFAQDSFAPGQLVCPARVEGRRTPAGRFTNHSGTPNVYPHYADGRINWMASRYISPGQEITINYLESFAVARLADMKESTPCPEPLPP